MAKKPTAPRAKTPAPKKRRGHSPVRRAAEKPRAAEAPVDVDALVVAASRVVAEQGFSGATIAAMAKAAGVSVASVKHEFEDREAVLTAVVHRHLDEMSAVLAMGFVSAESLPLESAVRALVRATVEAYRRAPELHRRMVREAPTVGRLRPLAALEALVLDALKEWVSSRPDVAVRDAELAAFLVYKCIDAGATAALFDRPDWLKEDAFVAELSLMMSRYLGGGAPPRL